ncbi:unnamed protein product, partial [Leptosia nina]
MTDITISFLVDREKQGGVMESWYKLYTWVNYTVLMLLLQIFWKISQISNYFKQKPIEDGKTERTFVLTPLTRDYKFRRHIRSMSDVQSSTPYRLPFRAKNNLMLTYDSDTRTRRTYNRYDSSDSSDYMCKAFTDFPNAKLCLENADINKIVPKIPQIENQRRGAYRFSLWNKKIDSDWDQRDIPSSLIVNVLKMKILAILFILKLINADPTPIVLWHGMGDTCCFSFSLGSFKIFLEDQIPDVYVHSLRIGDSIIEDMENGYFMSPNKQVDYVCDKISNDRKLRHGFHAIGFSQGCQFFRAVIQRCGHKLPQVKNFISLGGQHQGVYGLPHCGALQHQSCDYIRKLLNYAAYY